MDKQDLSERLQSYNVDELEFIAKQARVEANKKKADACKDDRKIAHQKKMEDKKLMTQMKHEEADALWAKAKNERRAQFSGKVKKGDMVSFLLKRGSTKPTAYLGKVTKVTPNSVKIDAASAGILHEYDPELAVDYGFITAIAEPVPQIF